MSDDTKLKNSELAPSTNQNLLNRKYSLDKQLLKHVHEVNKPQIRVRWGDSLDSGIPEAFSELIEFGIKERYDLKFGVSGCSEEIVELAENGAIDILIIFTNNFTIADCKDRMANSLKLITQIRTNYRIPVIAMAALYLGKDGSSIIDKIKRAANFFFWAPPKTEDFMAAFEQCLRMNPGPNKG